MGLGSTGGDEMGAGLSARGILESSMGAVREGRPFTVPDSIGGDEMAVGSSARRILEKSMGVAVRGGPHGADKEVSLHPLSPLGRQCTL
jgi:hypothetical protein